jgi:hypothetical protein
VDIGIFNLSGSFRNDGDQPLQVELDTPLPEAAFLDGETRAGRLRIDDCALAAEFFAGMVIGSHQTGRLLGVDSDLKAPIIDRISREAASRFVRAYGP